MTTTAAVSKILLIDDDTDDFELLSEAVREVDPKIEVSYIHSCEDLVRYRRHRFDIVLLDINMPEHDGFYWLKAIRDNGYGTPVVMYSNSMSPAHISKAYREGANLYFSKPESFAALLTGVKKLVGLDWSDPQAVTADYTAGNLYKTFPE